MIVAEDELEVLEDPKVVLRTFEETEQGLPLPREASTEEIKWTIFAQVADPSTFHLSMRSRRIKCLFHISCHETNLVKLLQAESTDERFDHHLFRNGFRRRKKPLFWLNFDTDYWSSK